MFVGGIGDDEPTPRLGVAVEVVSLAKVDAAVVSERVGQTEGVAAVAVVQVPEFRAVHQRRVVVDPDDFQWRRS